MGRRRKYWRSIWIDKAEIWGSQNICFYCGAKADSIDHVISYSRLRKLIALEDKALTQKIISRRALKVWACRECNCLLRDSTQESLSERKVYLKKKLRRRYKHILELPHWEPDEIEELGYNMKVYVTNSQKFKDYIKLRVAH